MIDRRSLITGVLALVTAPNIVRASSLMPVRTWRDRPWWVPDGCIQHFDFVNNRAWRAERGMSGIVYTPFAMSPEYTKMTWYPVRIMEDLPGLPSLRPDMISVMSHEECPEPLSVSLC